MTELLKKDRKFEWTDDCEASFNELKTRLTTAPVLVLPDAAKSYDVYCDASRRGLGAVLMQEGKVQGPLVAAKEAVVVAVVAVVEKVVVTRY